MLITTEGKTDFKGLYDLSVDYYLVPRFTDFIILFVLEFP